MNLAVACLLKSSRCRLVGALGARDRCSLDDRFLARATSRQEHTVIRAFTVAIIFVLGSCQGMFEDRPPDDLCDGVTCSGHGGCVSVDDNSRAVCVCDTGFHPEELECVLDASDGDADGDADPDADVDADAVSDADHDAEVEVDGDSLSGACTNASDREATARADYGAGNDLTYADLTLACGQSCVFDPDPATCSMNCLQTRTENAASDACASCFVMNVTCMITHCVMECMAGTGTDDCIACQCGNNSAGVNCLGGFEACSGLLLSTPCPD